ncbi:hypothetical protein COV94_04590 [Candidatus Woesearchaeota archaeon CG11_big_fil_rev_8_21_14_0_20_57_5]|nr:MAG: hypothetical protein COV94_04590 [Candidatus Woesearchaeota archaeon CG11_big_fil_rev_8_21_14_0_20_57_5]
MKWLYEPIIGRALLFVLRALLFVLFGCAVSRHPSGTHPHPSGQEHIRIHQDRNTSTSIRNIKRNISPPPMDKSIFNRKVIPMFAGSLLIATLGVFIGFFIPPILFIPIVIAEFVILIATLFLRRKGGFPKSLLYTFVLLTGITTAPIVYWAGLVGGPSIVLQALGLTTLVFGGLAAYVYKTGKDFRSIGVFLMFMLFGLIIASLINIFVGNGLFGIIIDAAVLLIFLGFVMYDMSMILRNYQDSQVTDAVLALYLDFLNIFIRILQLLVLSKRND